jgi:hypothetical protein
MLKHLKKYNSFFVLLFFVLLFFGCLENNLETSQDFKVQDSQVVFFVEDSMLNDLLESLLETTFSIPIEGLLQEEPLFSVIITNDPKEVTRSLNKNTNVLRVINIKSSKAKKPLTTEHTDDFISTVYWKKDTLKLKEELTRLKLSIEEEEILKIRRSFSRNSQKDIQESVLENFHVNIIIPKKYNVVVNRKDFFWANYDPSDKEEIKNICVFSFTEKESDLPTQVLYKVDSIFNKHFIGEKEGTFATIEKEFPVSISDNIYRGLWKLEGGFMGGVFVFKTYSFSSKTTVCLGFVFDPANSKRSHVKEFEAIL